MTRRRLATLLLALAGLLSACSPTAQSPSSSDSAASPSGAPTSASVPPSADTGDVVTPAPSATQAATQAATPQAPPPAPKGVKMTTKGHDPGNVGYDTELTVTVSWKSPLTKGTQIRVFGVRDCMPPPGKDPAPCLLKGTPLPASGRDLIARAPASKGKVSWTWPAWEDIGGNVAANGSTTYASIVVAAYNAAGHSRFVIVATGEFCSSCTY